MISKPFVLRTNFNDQVIIGRTKHFMHTYILPSELYDVIEDLVNVYFDIHGRTENGNLTDDELEKFYP